MWNYGEIDKYITLKDLYLIMKWFEETDKKTDSEYMVSSIDRNRNQYTIHLTQAQNGYIQKVKIEDGRVIDLGQDGFWMS